MKHLYWEYDAVATVYKGFTLTEMKKMTTRQRDYWYRMAKWRSGSS